MSTVLSLKVKEGSMAGVCVALAGALFSRFALVDFLR